MCCKVLYIGKVCEDIDGHPFSKYYFRDLISKVTTELPKCTLDDNSKVSTTTDILTYIEETTIRTDEAHVTVEEEDFIELDNAIYNSLLGIVDKEDDIVIDTNSVEESFYMGTTNKKVSATEVKCHNLIYGDIVKRKKQWSR